MARNWQQALEDKSDVQKLVHLAKRMDAYDVDRIRGELLRERRRYYEEELTAQALRSGCRGRTGRLGNGAILTALNDISQRDAASIVNTYNADLVNAIAYIRADTPSANRYTYAKRLDEWEQRRAAWKDDQIATYTRTSARTQAQQDFYRNNPAQGVAVLEPTRAVCPICQGWVARGEVPIHVALNNPPPYHLGCPHNWSIRYDRIPQSECRDLWMGE